MANPFYIQPAGDFSSGLMGLSDIIGKVQDRKRQEAAIQAKNLKIETAKSNLSKAIENQDVKGVQAAIIDTPELGPISKQAIEMKFPDGMADKLSRANLAAVLDVTAIPDLLKTADEAFAVGGWTDDEIKQFDKLKELAESDPKALQKQAEISVRLSGNKEYVSALDAMTKQTDVKTPTTAMGQYIKQNPNATIEDLVKVTGDLSAAQRKATEDKINLKTYSIKNEDGSTRTIKNVKPGSIQEKQLTETGFVEGSQTVGVKPSAKERAQEKINKQNDNFTQMANEDPNTFYEKYDYRQNEDGSLFIDPVTGGAQKLKSFGDVFGKRGNLIAIVGLGEQWDDAKELTQLLELPSVQEDLKKAEASGLWDQTKSKWTNSISKWMQNQGIKGDSPTATAIARIQRMASDERKKFMGTAVTDSELRSALAWMPNAGDSFDSVMNKTRLMGQEAEQEFRRWISIGEDEGADMSPFAKSFGIKRFTEEQEQPKVLNFDSQGNLI